MDDTTWQQILSTGYYLGAIASLLGVWQSTIDFRRKKERYRMLGVPAHLGLATALCFIILLSGPNPIFSIEFMRVGVRVAFMTWAIFKLSFMVGYVWTHVGIKEK
jgi:hypothetical protein